MRDLDLIFGRVGYVLSAVDEPDLLPTEESLEDYARRLLADQSACASQ